MKRWALRICVLLVVGTIVNVAVAWALAMWVNNPIKYQVSITRSSKDNPMTDPGYGTLTVRQLWCPGAMDIIMNRYRGGPRVPSGNASPESLLPEWTGLREPSAAYVAGASGKWAQPGNIGAEIAVVEVRGWPMLSLAVLHRVTAPSSGLSTRYGWNTRWMRTRTLLNAVPYPRAMPLQPVMPGFIVNSLLYACVLGMVMTGGSTIRRRRRNKRGLCPKCAYDLRGSVGATKCPECGAELAVKP